MKTVNNNFGIWEYFCDDIRESSPHINAHFFNLFTNLNWLFHKNFNDFVLTVRVNHFNQITLRNITNNSDKISLTFSHTYFIKRDSLSWLPTCFFLLDYLLKYSFYFIIAQLFFSPNLLHIRLLNTLINILFVSLSMPSFKVQKVYFFCGISLAIRTVKLSSWDF